MSFEEIEKQARAWLACTGSAYAAADAENLARFVLRALPVLKAADVWCGAQCDGEADICVETEFEHHEDCTVSKTEDDLYEAVVAFTEESK